MRLLPHTGQLALRRHRGLFRRNQLVFGRAVEQHFREIGEPAITLAPVEIAEQRPMYGEET